MKRLYAIFTLHDWKTWEPRRYVKSFRIDEGLKTNSLLRRLLCPGVFLGRSVLGGPTEFWVAPPNWEPVEAIE